MKTRKYIDDSKTRAGYSSTYTLLTTLVREREKQLIDYQNKIKDDSEWFTKKLVRKNRVYPNDI